MKRIGTIGHVDHGKTSLTAALVRLLAIGVDVKCGMCGGSKIVGGARYHASGTLTDARPCPQCSGDKPR